MAHQHDGSRFHANSEQELWFNMPSSSRRQHVASRTPEQSAYRSTTNRLSSGSTSSTSSRPYSNIPSISTTADTNKPLPPSPPASDRKKRRSSGLRTILGRPPATQQDSNYLQPEPYVSNSRYSATTNDLSINTQGPYHHTYSRSMPSSPYEHHQNSTSPNPANLTRAHSSAADYPESMEYHPYNPAPQASYQPGSMHPAWPSRSTSSNNYFEATPPRASTFPSEGVSNPTLRENVSSRPRPHTWLSPTESFSDASQFSLFAQATTGLPDDSDPFSPNGPPQLQGSLFARRSANDTIPIPPQRTEAAHGSYQLRTDWQNFEPPSFSTRSVSAPAQQYQDPAHISQINRELELLGLEDGPPSDDELPNYAQSQAEAHARRRQEASARARELEARWRSTRGR